MSTFWFIAACIASFSFGFIAACVMAMSSRMSEIEDQEREWVSENIPERIL
jgi:hypothetical protein